MFSWHTTGRTSPSPAQLASAGSLGAAHQPLPRAASLQPHRQHSTAAHPVLESAANDANAPIFASPPQTSASPPAAQRRSTGRVHRGNGTLSNLQDVPYIGPKNRELLVAKEIKDVPSLVELFHTRFHGDEDQLIEWFKVSVGTVLCLDPARCQVPQSCCTSGHSILVTTSPGMYT